MAVVTPPLKKGARFIWVMAAKTLVTLRTGSCGAVVEARIDGRPASLPRRNHIFETDSSDIAWFVPLLFNRGSL